MLLNKSMRIALLGLLLALNQIAIVLASVLDISSLTMMAAAALIIGFAIYESDLKGGACFFAASLILGFFLSPNKLYLISYAMMGVYVFIKELIDRRLRYRFWVLRLGIKMVLFNIYLIPILLIIPEVLLEAGDYQGIMMLVSWLLIQVVVVLCDIVYDKVLYLYHQKIRKLHKF